MCSSRGPLDRIALYGPRGAGKSTAGQLIASILGTERCEVIHSAAPLYELQEMIYDIANVAKPNHVQDGMLLASVAREVRRLNSDALAEYVIRRAESHSWKQDGRGLYLCDDSVIADRELLSAAGFRFVYVWAPVEIRLERRRSRGDVESGKDRNNPEVLKVDPDDFEVLNDGTLDDLHAQVHRLVDELAP
jgi:dephospho-CoA kinase